MSDECKHYFRYYAGFGDRRCANCGIEEASLTNTATDRIMTDDFDKLSPEKQRGLCAALRQEVRWLTETIENDARDWDLLLTEHQRFRDALERIRECSYGQHPSNGESAESIAETALKVSDE